MTFWGEKSRLCLTPEVKAWTKSLLRRFLTPYGDSNSIMGVQPVLHTKQLKTTEDERFNERRNTKKNDR